MGVITAAQQSRDSEYISVFDFILFVQNQDNEARRVYAVRFIHDHYIAINQDTHNWLHLFFKIETGDYEPLGQPKKERKGFSLKNIFSRGGADEDYFLGLLMSIFANAVGEEDLRGVFLKKQEAHTFLTKHCGWQDIPVDLPLPAPAPKPEDIGELNIRTLEWSYGEEIGRLKGDLERAKNQIKELEAEQATDDELRKQLAQAKNQIEELKALQSANDDLRNQLAQAKERIKKLESDNLSGKSRTAFLHIVGSLVGACLSPKTFNSQNDLVNYLSDQYKGYSGISVSNLNSQFAKANEYLKNVQ